MNGSDARLPGPPAETLRPALLVVQIGPPEPLDRGPAIHRTLQPCRALGELADVTVVSGFTLSPAIYDQGLLMAADILVLRDVADPDLLPVIAARRRQGRLTAYEIGCHFFASPPGDESPATQSDLVARSRSASRFTTASCTWRMPAAAIPITPASG